MRDITRLALVTAISFGVVGTAMMSANNGSLRVATGNVLATTQQLAASVVADFTSRTSPTATLPAGTQLLRIPRPDPPHWAGLQGFPDTTDIAFRLPGGVVAQSGTLDLVLHSELAAGGDGRVGVLVDGTLRSENVLAVGTQTIAVSIPLAASDLLGSLVQVELTSQGTTGSGEMCPTDAANSGSVVAIDATSGLSLVIATPALGPELALFGASEPLQMALDASEGGARAIWGRQRLSRGGLDVALASPVPGQGQFTVVADSGSPGIGGTADDYLLAGAAGLDRLLALRADGPNLATAWPVPVLALKGDTTIKTFRGVQRWSLTYALADLPDGVLPGQLTLAIAGSQLAVGSDWLLSVALNGVLVQSSRLAGQAALLTVVVPLAAELQQLTNTISIDLVDTSPNVSVCRTSPDARAQITPATQLLALAPQPATGWSALIAQLSHDTAIHLAVAGDVDLSEAARLSDLLGQILPATSTAVFGVTTAPRHLVLVGSTGLAGALLASAPAGTAADPRLLIHSATRASSAPTLVALEGTDLAALTASMEAGDVAILVTD